MVNVGIVGGAGYTGGEMIRLLIHHPLVNLSFVHSRSNAHQSLYKVHKDLLGETEMCFTDTLIADIEVLFLCLGHGESQVFLANNSISATVKVIDLSQDFRLGATEDNRTFVYGLPELNKESIKEATNIANPGCFATAIQLGLLPLAKAGLLVHDIHTTGITGSTGAGQKLQATTQHSWRNNNVNAYKTLTHQHLLEINHHTQPKGSLHFVPWRGDFARGIFVTTYIQCELSLEVANHLFKTYYEGAAFTFVATEMIDVKMVVNTNKCFIYLEKEGDQLVIHTAIDNLIKGASGQAIHNMNLMLGFPERSGLNLKSIVF